MADFRQIKLEEDTDLEFRRGIEELMSDQLLRRRRRSAFGGDDDLAESSAAALRQSRILSRWVARQAEEMITTLERRNRESELLALAGLHSVSMPRHRSRSPPPPSDSVGGDRILPAGDQDRSESEFSRENTPEDHDQDLGGERERDRVREIVSRISEPSRNERSSPRSEEWLGENARERVRSVREWVQMASERRSSRDGSEEEGPPDHVRRDLLRIRGRQARLDLITRMARERESEVRGLQEHRAVSEFPHRNRIQSLLRGRFLRNERPAEDERPPSVAAREIGLLRQRHSVSGLREGFRFRLENIVRGQASSHSDSLVSQNINSARSDQPPPLPSVDPSNNNHEQSQSGHSRDIRQTTETRTTADVESSRPNDDMDWQEPVTQAEDLHEEGAEIGERDQQHSSEIRRGDWQQSEVQEESLQEESAELGRRDWQQSTEVDFSDWHDEIGEESDGNWEENVDQDWSREITADGDGEGSRLPEGREWQDNDSHENLENWQEGRSDPPSEQHSIPISRVNRFIPSDDDNVYSMELRELLSRRTVSNLLSSGFRESLDQLIQSYVQRQVHTPVDWDIQGTLPTPASAEEDLNQQMDNPNNDQQDSAARPPLVLPSPPPVPPRQPLWHSDLHHNNWTRQNMHRSESEWDIISDLRADMNRLQQGMNHMQRMLEACMDMQLELQRSVRQEVSAALNRHLEGQAMVDDMVDGSKWSQVRKGNCCICCDSHIDALLYRCGHMCTCSKCANELVRGGGKCPLCRAPIIEVIRAYSIL